MQDHAVISNGFSISRQEWKSENVTCRLRIKDLAILDLKAAVVLVSVPPTQGPEEVVLSTVVMTVPMQR
jgi:hypothetical protein